MADDHRAVAPRAAGESAFARFIRTGRIEAPAVTERKFNPWHDPDDGRFTFAGQGVYYARGGGASGGPNQRRPVERFIRAGGGQSITIGARTSAPTRFAQPVGRLSASTDNRVQALAARAGGPASATLLGSPALQVRPPKQPRERPAGMGHNAPPDVRLIEQAFPGLRIAPGGAIVAAADNLVDLTGPARRATQALTRAESRSIINEIRSIDPSYRFQSLGEPQTLQGQAEQMRGLRLDRAVTFFRVRGDAGYLQIEVLKEMQRSADRAYQEGVARFERGLLTPRLSREEAIGNFVDRQVRSELRITIDRLGIARGRDSVVRVVGREYDTSGTDATFRIPDARVGRLAFDVTLTRKTLAKPQIQGFFNGDFRPDGVIIVRPRQLGPSATYIIKRPGQ